MRPGLYLTHKPVGATSFSTVRAFQQELAALPGRQPPVCHGGTLDPFAEGLLLVLVGAATRLMDLLHAVPKAYEAEVVWGVEMDNGDLGGRPVFQGSTAGLTPQALEEALRPWLGWREQVPPATSAKKVRGEPAYRRVHRGEQVELPPSRVYLHEARWLEHELPVRSRLRLVCRGGYYVRALARDMGRALGCGAHLARLRRTAIGPWEDPGQEQRVGVYGEALLPWYARRVLSDREMGALKRGEPLERGTLLPPTWSLPAGFPEPQALVRALHQGRLVALLGEEQERLVLHTPLRGGL